MGRLTFRCDDYSANTDRSDLAMIVRMINKKYPDARIIFAVSLLSKFNNFGSVYRDTPFKDKPIEALYNVDTYIRTVYYDKTHSFPEVEFASHGLLHVDHSHLSYDAQKMSILTSCNLIKTNIFVPPFNRYNEDTIRVCIENDIEIFTRNSDWLSCEHNDFDENHDLWYFHAWRWKSDDFERYLCQQKK